MSNFCKPLRATQRGDVLLESLVGILLVGILGAGIAHVASRISVSQHDAKLENLVAERLRDRLQRDGLTLCDAPALPIDLAQDIEVAVTVDCKRTGNVEVGVAGALKTVPMPRQITLRATPDDQGAIEVGTHQVPEETP